MRQIIFTYLPRIYRKFCLALLLLFSLIPATADAHVKWFATYNSSQAPLPVANVFNTTFVTFLVGAIFCTYLFFAGDRYALQRGYFTNLDLRYRIQSDFAAYILRGAACVFYISLYLYYLATGKTFLLTPELKTSSSIIPWVHLLLGLCALSFRSTPIVGFGTIGLYVIAIMQYGLFQLLDYPIFLGVSYFFIVSYHHDAAWRQSGFIVLCTLTGITLLWASIEKWEYPQWTYPLLDRDPDLLLGMRPYPYMVLAGFVEFTVAFLLLFTVSIVKRFIALGLATVFILAIFKFGLIDAIGHLMIIMILVVMTSHGTSTFKNNREFVNTSIWKQASLLTALYAVTFFTIFALYYGIHYWYYGV